MAEPLDSNEPDFGVVHKVARGVYTLPTRFSFMGAHPINNRSIIVHVPGSGRGALAIINPAELLPEAEEGLRKLQDELEAPVRYLISPGDWHYLFIGPYLRVFPEARAYVPPGRIPSKAPLRAHSARDRRRQSTPRACAYARRTQRQRAG